MDNILFKNITFLKYDGSEFLEEKNSFIGVRNGKIDYIGKEYMQGYDREYNGTGCCLIPAFYNAHSHSPMSLLRGYAENMSLNDWLFKKIFPFEATLTPEDIYMSTLLSFAEMIRFGCVSTTDMYYNGESMAKAVLDSHVKSNISLAATIFNSDSLKKENEALIKNYKDASQKLKIDISVHAPYTSTPGIVKEFSDLALENGLNMHIHLSETEQENIDCKSKYNLTPTEYFYKNGAFRVPVTAAHCVWLEETDIDILKEHSVTVATCPASNFKLASGFCDVNRLIKRGINVALGTDSVASNNNLDMISDMRLLALLSKGIHKDPTLITPSQAFFTATRAGALSQGRTDCGLIEEGYCADLAVINLNKPHLTPVHDILNTLLYSANGADVVLTMCDGEILYENGEYRTVDTEKIMFYARRRIETP